MADNARALVAQAEKKLKSGGGLFSFLSGGPKYDEAMDLYQQAANQYKLAKDWQEAGNCFIQCAYCAKKSGSTTDEATQLMEAGNVLKKVSTTDAVEQYEKAIAIYNAAGRFSQSAKLLVTIAEMFEAERVTGTEAKEYYKRAAELFDMDDHGKSNLTKCRLKMAEYCAKDGEYQESIEIFENEGEKALQSTLLQYGAKDHFLRAGILHMVVGDSVTAKLAVERYNGLDPRFASSREGELLGNLVEAFDERDGEKFVDKLAEYDEVTKLDNWKTEFLVKVKDAIAPSGIEGGNVDLT